MDTGSVSRKPCIRHWEQCMHKRRITQRMPEYFLPALGRLGAVGCLGMRSSLLSTKIPLAQPFCQEGALQAARLALPTSRLLSRADTLCWLPGHLRHGVYLSKPPLPLPIFLFSHSSLLPTQQPDRPRKRTHVHAPPKQGPGRHSKPPNVGYTTRLFLLFLRSNGNHACLRAFALAVLPPAPF